MACVGGSDGSASSRSRVSVFECSLLLGKLTPNWEQRIGGETGARAMTTREKITRRRRTRQRRYRQRRVCRNRERKRVPDDNGAEDGGDVDILDDVNRVQGTEDDEVQVETERRRKVNEEVGEKRKRQRRRKGREEDGLRKKSPLAFALRPPASVA